MITVLIIAAVLVAIAEFGDKTQMLSLVLASRYPARTVLAGVGAAVLLLQLIATGAGRIVGDLIPERALALLTAALFVGFGIWTLRDASDSGEESVETVRGGWGPAAAVAVAFFVAELGDKTQVLTLAIAADPGMAARVLAPLGIDTVAQPGGVATFFAVWIGSSIGMMVVNGLAILAGNVIGRRLSRRLIARISGVLFILFGLAALAASYLS